MNKMLFLLIFLASNVYAKTVTLEIPENVFSNDTKIIANFDGSISIVNPLVLVSGRYLSVEDYYDPNVKPIVKDGYTSLVGLCSLVGKSSWVASNSEGYPLSAPTQIGVVLSVKGTILSLFNKKHFITEVICK